MNNKIAFSKSFLNSILDNTFGIPNSTYPKTDIYVGLGTEFDEDAFAFTKEPVAKGFTILGQPIAFNEPINGIIRNTNPIEWPKATCDWTDDNETISYVGLYYRKETDTVDGNIQDPYEYELICVLPLVPEETVKLNEKLVLNANSIQIRLANR